MPGRGNSSANAVISCRESPGGVPPAGIFLSALLPAFTL
jgi:hypothetical protein